MQRKLLTPLWHVYVHAPLLSSHIHIPITHFCILSLQILMSSTRQWYIGTYMLTKPCWRGVWSLWPCMYSNHASGPINVAMSTSNACKGIRNTADASDTNRSWLASVSYIPAPVLLFQNSQQYNIITRSPVHTKPSPRASNIMVNWVNLFKNKETPLSRAKCHVGLNHSKIVMPHNQREGEGEEKYSMYKPLHHQSLLEKC